MKFVKEVNSMYDKSGWPAVRQQMESFWQGQNTTPLIAVTAPVSNQPGREAYPPSKGIQRWENYFSSTYFGGVAIPVATADFGDFCLSDFYGQAENIDEQADGLSPCIAKSSLWQEILRETEVLAAQSQGRFFVGIPELGSAGDVLSILMGMGELCIAMSDHGAAVLRKIKAIARDRTVMQRMLNKMVAPAGGGSIIPMVNVWAPGAAGTLLACDFASCISPAMFRAFFGDIIQMEAAAAAYAVFHVDGAKMMKTHLADIIKIPGIHAVEWIPGDGAPPVCDDAWVPYYRKIREAGKRIIVHAAPEEALALYRKISPEGILAHVQCRSQAQAGQLLFSAGIIKQG